MKRVLISCAALATLGSTASHAEGFRPLTQRCEEALALSALPVELRERADVYVWLDGDFEKTIASGGDFHCVVQRNHPESIIPECITATGKDSILEGIFEQTKMTASGMSAAAVAEQSAALVEQGKIASPSAPGVNYMMSSYNRIYNVDAGSIVEVPPHTMFFAPHATNDAVGGSFEMARATKGFPFVVEAGAHSYIVTFTDKGSDNTDVEQHCRGQI